ncbi:pyridoxal 5'-phosphate synthase pdxS subunit [Arthrobacter bambusae]|nr:pyridoxal 5'-phosphate synthase pdxS subunit [Arthrobacter bambusae]
MDGEKPVTGSSRVKRGMAEMLKGGVIMDVVNAEQARIAEDAGAVAVIALERVPADIRAQGGVSRMSDPDMIDQIIAAVSVPVMAKARIGHFVEAQVLQSLGVDYIDESEVLTPADYTHHIDKWNFTVPFFGGATDLGEALRRINEGAAMIRSKGEAGTGDVSNATTQRSRGRGQRRAVTAAVRNRLKDSRPGSSGRLHASHPLPAQEQGERKPAGSSPPSACLLRRIPRSASPAHSQVR